MFRRTLPVLAAAVGLAAAAAGPATADDVPADRLPEIGRAHV